MKYLILALALFSTSGFAADIEYLYNPQLGVICFEDYDSRGDEASCTPASGYNVQGLKANQWTELPGLSGW